ncbi:hypothetical protein CIW52_12585 [Mycolicibacterium sp. P9-64]|uniref:hypothetical protein n=1 Tax=Mycolicibacterium sp. P9-64 TaxID=2024612 RepID=UPI0011F027F6|nr:hypothetical protein [Mycolicibacterium sp. P9-64]KAA0083267.1 hypothetical protein CIW52_12585 [Mycolicibacterium sp. P9-64]
MSDHTETIAIRRVQAFTYATVAQPDGTPLHLIDIRYPNGDLLDANALTNAQLAEHITACQKHLSAALENEHRE